MNEEREAQRGRAPAEGAERDNPTEPELEVEGPNQSAPGHEPADAAEETDGEQGAGDDR